MNLNKVSLIGNLVADPLSKKTPAGMDLAIFRIATNHAWHDRKTKKLQESVEFHPIIAWGKLATVAGKYLKKGSKIYLEGRLATRTWDDEAGVKHYMTEIIASNLIMLGHRQKQESQPEELASEDIAVEEVKRDELKD